MLMEMMTINTTPYAAAAPRLKSRSSDAIAIEIGRFAGHRCAVHKRATYQHEAAERGQLEPIQARLMFVKG